MLKSGGAELSESALDVLFSDGVSTWRELFRKGLRYKCNQCEYKATRKTNLTAHIQSVHEGLRYVCNQCEYKATWKCNLATHIETVHEGVRYGCDQCEYKSAQQDYLRKHKQFKHAGSLHLAETKSEQSQA